MANRNQPVHAAGRKPCDDDLEDEVHSARPYSAPLRGTLQS